MSTYLRLAVSNEITQKLSDNAALKKSVVELGQEIEKMFLVKLSELIRKHTREENTSLLVETSWKAPWLATAANGADLLLSDLGDADHTLLNKPNLLEFATSTGVDLITASSLLYGVTGLNTDVRDWQKIMASRDPVLAARNATAAMLGPHNPALIKIDQRQLPIENIVAKTENFTWIQKNGRDLLFLTDSVGNQLREVGLNTPSILGSLQDFGMNPVQLVELADQLDNAGVDYKPWQMHAGSDAGVDLRALGEGRILSAMAFDWRTANNSKLAESLGVPRKNETFQI